MGYYHILGRIPATIFYKCLCISHLVESRIHGFSFVSTSRKQASTINQQCHAPRP